MQLCVAAEIIIAKHIWRLVLYTLPALENFCHGLYEGFSYPNKIESVGCSPLKLMKTTLETLSPVSYTHLDVYKRQV